MICIAGGPFRENWFRKKHFTFCIFETAEYRRGYPDWRSLLEHGQCAAMEKGIWSDSSGNEIIVYLCAFILIGSISICALLPFSWKLVVLCWETETKGKGFVKRGVGWMHGWMDGRNDSQLTPLFEGFYAPHTRTLLETGRYSTLKEKCS